MNSRTKVARFTTHMHTFDTYSIPTFRKESSLLRQRAGCKRLVASVSFPNPQFPDCCGKWEGLRRLPVWWVETLSDVLHSAARS